MTISKPEGFDGLLITKVPESSRDRINKWEVWDPNQEKPYRQEVDQTEREETEDQTPPRTPQEQDGS